MNFNKRTVMEALSQSTTEYFHHPKKFPHVSAPSPCTPLTTSDLCLLLFPDWHINVIMLYIAFWVWLLSLHLMHL